MYALYLCLQKNRVGIINVVSKTDDITRKSTMNLKCVLSLYILLGINCYQLSIVMFLCFTVFVRSHPNYTAGGTIAGEPSPPWRIKIVMSSLRLILRDEFQTIHNSPLRSSSSTVPGIDVDPKKVALKVSKYKKIATQNIFNKFYLKIIQGNYKYTQMALKTRKEE